MSINLTGESLIDQLKKIEEEAEQQCRHFTTLSELEDFRIKYLGRRGVLAEIFENLKSLSSQEKPQVGKLANQVKLKVEELFEKRLLELKSQDSKRGQQVFDYTLPGRKGWKGSLHPLTQVRNEIVDIFYGMGFEVVYGPEIETDYYNFEALNIPPDHPARDLQDTFYLPDNLLLRTHTSPVQIRTFEKRKPPLKILAPGRVFRHESINVRSYCVFHQVEGFYVDKNVSFADLKGVLSGFVTEFFGKEINFRFRPSYYPFTEPSADVDISCILCKGKGCSLCKYQGWLEILGCGMIHPEVFKNVKYDYEKFSGYAFGMGIERICMLKYGIDDIRLFYENDLKFLRQF
ncbi:MAG: phenylalanine--tRNA ligase subunit alpha [candidate division Zixibacteria bacterium RBG_16_40_9]|nr:MAG: phenylalanine--tRNA ligase subunit alpha [candidate division Zixibacteria bacterium RBG_16_40_9]